MERAGCRLLAQPKSARMLHAQAAPHLVQQQLQAGRNTGLYRMLSGQQEQPCRLSRLCRHRDTATQLKLHHMAAQLHSQPRGQNATHLAAAHWSGCG